MDNKTLKIGGLVVAIVAALAILVVLFTKNAGDGQGARTAEQSEVLNALEKVGNDPSKLDAATKAKFDQMNANNPFSSVNHYSQKPAGSSTAGSAPAGGGSGMPSNYPRPGGL